MSTAVLMERFAEASPQLKARAAGVFWLTTILTGLFGMFVWGRLVVSGNAAATAANILANESLYGLGSTADLVGLFCYVAVTLLAYELFKPVNRNVSLLAAFFSLVGCAIGALGYLLRLAPMAILGGPQYLSVFTVEQRQAWAFTFLRVRAETNNVGLVFFGFHCILIGYLIWRSTFLPRVVGALMVVAGLGWLTFLSPPLAGSLYPYITVPGFLGEASLTVWLLVAGVNVQRWNEQASAALETLADQEGTRTTTPVWGGYPWK